MQHRHAPAVQYPVGRSRVEGLLIALVALAGGAAACAWAWVWQGDVSPLGSWLRWDARPLWMLALLACLVLAAARAWWRTPQGVLAWDGAAWHWSGAVEGGGHTAAGGWGHAADADPAPGAVHAVQLVTDLQFALLLRPLDARGRALGWVWAERACEPALWKPLRRALLAGGGTA